MPNGGVQPIGDAAVVGAGDDGKWIALGLALGDFKVVLVDSSREKLRQAVEDVGNALGSLERQEMVDRSATERAWKHQVPWASVAGAMVEVRFAEEATENPNPSRLSDFPAV